jgi:hypothetical protein
MHYTFIYHFDPIVVENLLVVLCLADRTPIEVGWQVSLVGFRDFYTLIHEWNNLRNWNS